MYFFGTKSTTEKGTVHKNIQQFFFSGVEFSGLEWPTHALTHLLIVTHWGLWLTSSPHKKVMRCHVKLSGPREHRGCTGQRKRVLFPFIQENYRAIGNCQPTSSLKRQLFLYRIAQPKTARIVYLVTVKGHIEKFHWKISWSRKTHCLDFVLKSFFFIN